MKYFRLIDGLNNDTIVMKKDDGYFYRYSYGTEVWLKTAIMTKYHWADSSLYGQYEQIDEEVALESIETQRKELENLYLKALEVSENAHANQVDKGNKPYILHPLWVADALDDMEQKIVALLHDVVEDSDISLVDLDNYGFTKRIIKSVKVLTKRSDESYDDYLKAIKKDTSAKNVKTVDLRHNMDMSRIPNPATKDFERLEKYRKALDFLEA